MRRGFTLVELLVVMAVIALLAAIILPVLAKARTQGRISRCQANLRQIGLAFQMYADDCDGAYPNNGDPFLWMGRRWRWPLKRYLALAAQQDPANPNNSTGSGRSVLLCPDDLAARQKFDGTSYGYSLAFYHTPAQVNAMTTADEWSGIPPTNVSQTVSAVQYPTKKALVGEWNAFHSDYRNAAGNSPGWWEPGGARNYLFADGHVKFVDSSRILPASNGFPDINLTKDGVAGKDVE